MPPTLSTEFDTRRDAEMTVEHLVQEYGIDRGAITVVAASDDNSAGTRVSGSDLERGDDKPGSASEPALAGGLRVSVEVDPASADKVTGAFATYGGRTVT